MGERNIHKQVKCCEHTKLITHCFQLCMNKRYFVKESSGISTPMTSGGK